MFCTLNVKRTGHVSNERRLSAIRTSLGSRYRDDVVSNVAGHEPPTRASWVFRAQSVALGRVRLCWTTRMRGQSTSAAFETRRSVSLESTGFCDRSTGDVTRL